MYLALMLQLCRAGKPDRGTWTTDRLAGGFLSKASTLSHTVQGGLRERGPIHLLRDAFVEGAAGYQEPGDEAARDT